VPSKYITQIQWQLACTQRKWCDFVSYDPRLPDNLALFIKRVDADVTMIESLESEVKKFLVGVNDKVSKLRKLNV